ncbi:ImuA family protein [Pedobacter endophyticus]|uniref:Error-prone repair protein ImuA n=1 Tax=Pedobacter endophyticus TaxID=2789740 RepID=A0A7S9Q015_9SPHI|nr:Error-prone repair protein ImuA [Pedobacter endophyticus]QPH40475.1 Error-prone repair protein ImuA [Pedobacter endophyticus]
MLQQKKDIVEALQKQILLLQGVKPSGEGGLQDIGLPQICNAFPNGIFPSGAIHEFLGCNMEDAAASGGFITALMATLMRTGTNCIWISTKRTLYPASLNAFGISPDRLLFIDLKSEKDVLWATEEALKCSSIAVVVSELDEISFAQSRRLQLVVEKSRVTGFLIRRNAEKLSNTICVARWKISPLPSREIDDLPGLGFPNWQVALLKVRNGLPGSWNVSYLNGAFCEEIPQAEKQFIEEKRREAI